MPFHFACVVAYRTHDPGDGGCLTIQAQGPDGTHRFDHAFAGHGGAWGGIAPFRQAFGFQDRDLIGLGEALLAAIRSAKALQRTCQRHGLTMGAGSCSR